MKFVILLHKVAYDYVTLFDVYEYAINPRVLESPMEAGQIPVCGAICPGAEGHLQLAHDDLGRRQMGTLQPGRSELHAGAGNGAAARELLKRYERSFREKR